MQEDCPTYRLHGSDAQCFYCIRVHAGFKEIVCLSQRRGVWSERGIGVWRLEKLKPLIYKCQLYYIIFCQIIAIFVHSLWLQCNKKCSIQLFRLDPSMTVPSFRGSSFCDSLRPPTAFKITSAYLIALGSSSIFIISVTSSQ